MPILLSFPLLVYYFVSNRDDISLIFIYHFLVLNEFTPKLSFSFLFSSTFFASFLYGFHHQDVTAPGYSIISALAQNEGKENIV